MKTHWKGTLLVLWLLSQTLGFALLAQSLLASQALPPHAAWEQSQPSNHGYDDGSPSFGDYDEELSAVTTRDLGDLLAKLPATAVYDSAPVSPVRIAVSVRARSVRKAEFVAAKEATSLPQYYIENGVRRSIASREAQLGEIPATIYREGQPPLNTTLRLDQLHSPKPEIPLNQRLQNIQPPIHTPIQVQPLGVPGQMPTVPLNEVKIVPPGG